MTTKREVIGAIGAALGDIQVANSYHTDIGLHVFYALELDVEWQKDCVVFRLDPDATFNLTGNQHETTLHLEISGYAWNVESEIALSNLFEDLTKAIGKDRSFGLKGVNTQLVRLEEYAEVEGAIAVRSALFVDVTYRSVQYLL